MVPEALHRQIESALGSRAMGVKTMGGGCISNASLIETEAGRVFLKWGKPGEFPRGLFAAEADALAILASGQEIRLPNVLGIREEESDYGWLLLEWLEPGHASREGWEALGRSLAQLHRRKGESFGWHAPNFIGSLPQANARSAHWPAFWRDQRIVPQLYKLGSGERKRIEAMLAHVEELAGAGNEDGASLLHGDLWSGNVHALENGSCALIDPSSYFGHREVDLAMATLFGGFHERFFNAYEEEWPLLAGYEQRRHLYQLYYLLVHVNLFGWSYLPGTMAAVGKLGF